MRTTLALSINFLLALLFLTPTAPARARVVICSTQPVEVRESANTPDYEGRADVLINPDLSAVQSVARKYWKCSGGAVVEMSAAEKSSLDAAEATARRDAARAQAVSIEAAEDAEGVRLRTVLQLTIDENNSLRQWITDFKAAVAASTTLADFKVRVAALPNTPARTYTQARNGYKNKINAGESDQ